MEKKDSLLFKKSLCTSLHGDFCPRNNSYKIGDKTIMINYDFMHFLRKIIKCLFNGIMNQLRNPNSINRIGLFVTLSD